MPLNNFLTTDNWTHTPIGTTIFTLSCLTFRNRNILCVGHLIICIYLLFTYLFVIYLYVTDRSCRVLSTTYVLYTEDVSGSYLCLDTYWGYSWFSKVPPGCHPNPLIYSYYYITTLYSMSHWQRRYIWCYGVVSQEAPQAMRRLLIYCVSSSEF
jgi:hypothetical protein